MAQQFQGNDFWSALFDQSTEQKQKDTNKSQTRPQEPAIDLYQTPTAWVVVADLPGVDKSAIRLTCTGNAITIKGETKRPFQDAEALHTERFYGSFERTIQLPEATNITAPHATFHNGVLTIRIPRETPPAYSIDIE